MSIGVFGGTTQVVITWPIAPTGQPTSPAWYVAGTGLVATPLLPERAAEDPNIDRRAGIGERKPQGDRS